jgi:hypothetical protein
MQQQQQQPQYQTRVIGDVVGSGRGKQQLPSNMAGSPLDACAAIGLICTGGSSHNTFNQTTTNLY